MKTTCLIAYTVAYTVTYTVAYTVAYTVNIILMIDQPLSFISGNERTPVIALESTERIPVCSPSLKPKMGMIFKDLEDGIAFYDKYAEAAGFKSRLSSQKMGKKTIKMGETIDVIVAKHVLCNKAGIGEHKGTKQKRQITRVGCHAKIVFRRTKTGEYRVATFHEGHNHLLASPNTMVHLKQSRDLNLVHKKVIMDNSRVNQGPVRTFRMFKEYVRGYGNVGASLQDFKNFSRDVKKFIKDSDGQMVIEAFMQKRAMCSSFYFDFDVDSDGHLTRIFWADPIGIKNYKIFGDVVSFDTTFDMNKYKMVFAPFTGVDHHKGCITFAAGLLANESIESFTWLFDSFLKAMGGCYPTCIVTDQDAGIKGGIEKVFGKNTQHRLCMWHIMKKLNDKVGSSICRDTEFLKEFGACVWNEDAEISEFESKWCSIIEKYELSDNDWLTHMFNIRGSWIPAYFRDLFLAGILRTTSRSESENSFFGNFTNCHLTLVEFWMRYESAMDAQRWKQSKLIADSKNTFPKLETPLQLEKHASEFYTPTIFYEFQAELKAACFSCGVETIRKEDTEQIQIRDRERDMVCTVDFNASEEKLFCSCKRFSRNGILCRHALWVLKERGFERVPDTYMLHRWSKLATCRPLFNIDGTLMNDCASFVANKNKINELWSEMFSCVSFVENDDGDMDELIQLLHDFKSSKAVQTGKKRVRDKKSEVEMLIGTTIPIEVTILPPKQSKNKGSGKRLLSEKEKAVQEHKKAPRKCNACGEMGYHDSRNCPGKL